MRGEWAPSPLLLLSVHLEERRAGEGRGRKEEGRRKEEEEEGKEEVEDSRNAVARIRASRASFIGALNIKHKRS